MKKVLVVAFVVILGVVGVVQMKHSARLEYYGDILTKISERTGDQFIGFYEGGSRELENWMRSAVGAENNEYVSWVVIDDVDDVMVIRYSVKGQDGRTHSCLMGWI